jgi:hypothetical protein
VAIVESAEKTSKQIFLTPTSNLTWLCAIVRKCNFCANAAGIWPGAKYKSYRILSSLSNFYDISKLGRVLKFCSGQNCATWDIWMFDSHSNAISETFNTNIVSNFLNFLMATHMPRSDKWFRSCSLWKSSVAAGNSVQDRIKWLDQFGVLPTFKMKTR